jgi:hypothetical protein
LKILCHKGGFSFDGKRRRGRKNEKTDPDAEKIPKKEKKYFETEEKFSKIEKKGLDKPTGL